MEMLTLSEIILSELTEDFNFLCVENSITDVEPDSNQWNIRCWCFFSDKEKNSIIWQFSMSNYIGHTAKYKWESDL